MSDIAIRVQNLSKQYRIGSKRERYKTLRDTLTDAVAAPFRRLSSVFRGRSSVVAEETIWALKDVSFEVKPGEVVGIIGRNGAGKTTLLKILSRITEPTEGWAEIHGRVGSLLEVGTGFHPELTGRDNITLNGAILGMKRREIDAKFDEIVAFAEVEKFIDTPVKHYSSGMYVRLAFAVAAHLEPEILLVDEVLAVGDAAFQKKCLGKMGKVAEGGRTVLFVSHNMIAVQQLCPRALLLEEGCLVRDAVSDTVVRHYLRSGLVSEGEHVWADERRAPGNDIVRLRAVRAVAADGQITGKVSSDQAFRIQMEYRVLEEGFRFNAGAYVFNESEIQLFTSLDNTDPMWHNEPRPRGVYKSTCHVPANLLAPGQISVTVRIKANNPTKLFLREYDAITVEILDGEAVRGDILRTFPGVIRPWLKWETDYEPEG